MLIYAMKEIKNVVKEDITHQKIENDYLFNVKRIDYTDFMFGSDARSLQFWSPFHSHFVYPP